jgi:hypothetical protein
VRRVFCALFLGLAAAAASPLFACDNSSSIYEPPGVEPQRVRVVGPPGATLHCRPTETGGNCPLPLKVTFQLPQGEFIAKAIVTFQGDGSDTGVDRYYAVPYTYGQGDGVDVTMEVDADIPTTILRENALFTYTVTLVTGAGARSTATTLTVSVT